MSTISRYVLVDANDNEQDHEYDDYAAAESAAEEQGCAVIERRYEYSDSELVWTPNGSLSWPPKRPATARKAGGR